MSETLTFKSFQRAAWFPYFDDINAIIFLAPISCYDETLVEDPSVNRIDDSITLWKGICHSKLLINVQLVVFFNKCDILQKKLKRGASPFVKYFPKFGNKHEDVENIGCCESCLGAFYIYPVLTELHSFSSRVQAYPQERKPFTSHVFSYDNCRCECCYNDSLNRFWTVK